MKKNKTDQHKSPCKLTACKGFSFSHYSHHPTSQQAGFYAADRLAPYAKTGHLELGGKCVLREALRGAGLVDSIAGDIGLALVCINLQTFSPRFT